MAFASIIGETHSLKARVTWIRFGLSEALKQEKRSLLRQTLAVTMAAELKPTSAAARLNSIIPADASMGSRNDFHAGGVSS